MVRSTGETDTTARPQSGGAGCYATTLPGTDAFAAWMEMFDEQQRFVGDRIRQDFETQRALFQCRSPLEAQGLLMEHARKAAEDYAAEFARVFQLAHKVPGAAGMLDG